ncbi:MAG: glycosyltransferase [Kofleriaceae bacterium]|nr:glycosyltransferase [Kofleriaceae bacterium]
MASWSKFVKGVVRDLPRWANQARNSLQRNAVRTEPLVVAAEQLLHSATAPLLAKVAAFRAILTLEAAQDLTLALVAGEELLPLVGESAAAHLALAGWYQRNHAIERPAQLVAQARALNPAAVATETRVEQQQRWLAQGLPLSALAAPALDPTPRRVVYVAASSLPYHSAGYGARTHALMRALHQRGWDMDVVARPGYPNDRWDYPHWALAPASLRIDDIPYWFAPNRAKLRFARDIEAYHLDATAQLEARCRDLRPALIHAASNYNCGLMAAEVGRRLGIPVVYEVRGLWHISKAAAEPSYEFSDHYRMIEGFEVQAAQAATHVFAITSGVANLLIDAGVAAEKISLLPNAAEVATFAPMPPDASLREQYNLGETTVLGYIGSLNTYEGLDDLFTAVAELRRIAAEQHTSTPLVKILIVGDGAARAALETQAVQLGLAAIAHFTGRLPPAEVRRYYSVIDIFVLPRKPTQVCELVSPLKPFEAMAMERCVVASNVAAQADIIDDGVTGRQFAKGDVHDLARVLHELIADADQRHRLGTAAGQWVRAERTWKKIADRVDAVYRQLTT